MTQRVPALNREDLHVAERAIGSRADGERAREGACGSRLRSKCQRVQLKGGQRKGARRQGGVTPGAIMYGNRREARHTSTPAAGNAYFQQDCIHHQVECK